MVMICQCRAINEKTLQQAFEKAREEKGGGDVAVKDTRQDLGNFKCGGCRPMFEQSAQQFNETGKVEVLKLPIRKAATAGLCSVAAKTDYTIPKDAPPDLTRSPIEGAEGSLAQG